MSNKPIQPKVTESRLFVNVNGGPAKLASTVHAKLSKGENQINLPSVGKGTRPGSIDVIEAGTEDSPFGSLKLVEASVASKGGANIVLEAKKTGEMKFVIPAEVNVAAEVRHRLAIKENGEAELSSLVEITNNGKSALPKDVRLTVTAGDNVNRGGRHPMFARTAYESANGDTGVSAVGSTVYRFDVARTIKNLAPGASVSFNLYGKDFEPKVKKDLVASGQTTTWKQANEMEGGSVQTTYRIANTKENGLGVVLPRGPVDIVRPDGTLLSSTDMQSTPVGHEVPLDGGRAFDIEMKRKQTSYEESAGGPAEGGGSLRKLKIGQEVTLKNCGKQNESVRIEELLPSSDGNTETKVTAVQLNGTAVPASGFEIKNGRLSIANVALKPNDPVKLSYTVQFSEHVY